MTKKANNIHVPVQSFDEKMIFKKLFQLLLTKVSYGFELRISGSQDQCLRPLNFDDIEPNWPIKAISQNI